MRIASFASSLLLLVLAATGLSAQSTVHQSFPISNGHLFEIDTPTGWKAESHGAEGVVDLRFTSATSADFRLVLTFLRIPDPSPVTTPEDLRKLVEEQGATRLPGAVQTRLEIISLPLPAGTGFLYHLTDKNPEKGPGDYREARQGALLLNGYLVPVSVLTHPSDEALAERVVAALSSARISVKPQAPPIPSSQERH